MINSNELRIGNWLNLLVGMEYVEIQLQADQFLMLSKHPSWGNPIELTEEWLLKFGFKKQNILKKVYKKDVYFLNGFRVDENTGTMAHKFDSYGVVEIKYVHQLQNLYFALTGEELTLIGPIASANSGSAT